MIGRAKPLACQELVEIVTAYLEGAMGRRDRKRFEAHISGCDNCHTYVEQMRQTIAATGSITEETIDPAARDELLEVFRGWKAAR
jgi:anti-sigma factor RsiW